MMVDLVRLEERARSQTVLDHREPHVSRVADVSVYGDVGRPGHGIRDIAADYVDLAAP